MLRPSLVRNALLLVLVLFGAFALLLSVFVARPLEGRARAQWHASLRSSAVLFAAAVDAAWDGAQLDGERLRGVQQQLAGLRLTVVATDGRVLFDSHEDPALMESHASRPERSRPGSVVERRSWTTKRDMLYVAWPLAAAERALEAPRAPEAPQWVRASLFASDVDAHLSALRKPLWGSFALALALALAAAGWAARRAARPIEELAAVVAQIGAGDVRERVQVPAVRELEGLGRAVNRAIDELALRLARMGREQLEKDAILAGMAEGVIAVDHDQRVVLANAAAREMLDAAERDPRGRPIWELTRVPEVVQTVADCMREDRHVRAEARLAREEGDRVLELAATPLSMSEQEARWGSVLVLHDVSELRRLEQVRRDFVANVSHELKTPLTAMRGYLETVLDDPDMADAVRVEFLTKAERSTERLAAIVTDLLTLARAESEVQRERELADLRELAEECVRDLRASAETKLIRIDLLAPGAELPILADSPMILAAIRNLLENAIKYSPEQSAIQVTAGRLDGYAWLEVADQGPGIPPGEQERIFERFYRVDKDRSRTLGGTGLGLSIVRNVLVAHGGDVNVKSQLGRGSRFRLRLPLAGQKR